MIAPEGAISMPSQRGVTALAVAAGAVIGALAALFGGAPPPPSPERDPNPANTPRRVEASAPLGAEAASVPNADAEPPSALGSRDGPTEAAPLRDAAATVTLLGTQAFDHLSPAEADAQCGMKKNAAACLAAAKNYAEGRRVAADAVKARAMNQLALTLFIDQCSALRDAEACYSLAELYDRGVGTPDNPETPNALRGRARQLCAERATPFCERLAAGTVK